MLERLPDPERFAELLGLQVPRMRFLFTTLQFAESDFYGRVSRGLENGPRVRARRLLQPGRRAIRGDGFTAWCVADQIGDAGRDLDVGRR